MKMNINTKKYIENYLKIKNKNSQIIPFILNYPQQKLYDVIKEQKKQIQNKLEILCENPAHPSLRVKRIKGTKSFWEMSVNMDIRIIFEFEGETIIILADIGHHNILRKF